MFARSVRVLYHKRDHSKKNGHLKGIKCFSDKQTGHSKIFEFYGLALHRKVLKRERH